MGRRVTIELGYEDDLALVLDPVSDEREHEATLTERLFWLAERASTLYGLPAYERMSEADVARVLASAVALYQADAGDLGACLDTAIVWERG